MAIVWPSDITRELIEQGISLESLKQEYGIDKLPSTQGVPNIEGNSFLTSTDDSGTHCIPVSEYEVIVDRLRKGLSTSDFNFVLRYIEGRISRYYSPRRGYSVALRGASYYRIVEVENQDILYHLLKEDFNVDARMLHFFAYCEFAIPSELVLLALDHFKNNLFRVMYAYIEKSLTEKDFFDMNEWLYLDGLAKTVWEMVARTLFQPAYRITSSLPLHVFNTLLEKVRGGNFSKLRELDSAKTQMRMAARIYAENKTYDYCVPLLYGGIEMPYALYGYGIVFKQPIFKQVIPVVFSLNRMKKGVFPQSIIRKKDGLLTKNGLSYLVPRQLLQQLLADKGARILIVDNNITTGYSIRVIRDSLAERGYACDLLVLEVNVQEIRTICENMNAQEEKVVLLRGRDFVVPPICEYVTCFGLQDTSRVVDRIKFLLGKGGYYDSHAYDFDDTIVITRHVHRETWRKALQRIGVEVDFGTMPPENTGLTFPESAERYYNAISERGIAIPLPKDRFILLLCRYKLEEMCKFDLKEIPVVGKTVNTIRDSFSNMQIVISNDRLEFVLYVLDGKGLLQYFSYIICEDFAYCVSTGEKIALAGQAKPSIEGYIEAASYFKLPPVQSYVGDSAIDERFASVLSCEYVQV